MNWQKWLKFWFPEIFIYEICQKYGFYRKAEKTKSVQWFEQAKEINVHRASGPAPAAELSQAPGAKFFGTNNVDVSFVYVEEQANPQVGRRKQENGPNLNDIHQTFRKIREDLSSAIVGQKTLLDQLVVAFKRPFVTGHEKPKPKNTVVVCGAASSGRKTCVAAMAKLMNQTGLLLTPKVETVDLSLYPTNAEQTLFLSDLYKALYSPNEVIVFDQAEKSGPFVISVLTALAVEGVYKMSSRYTFHGDMLIDATGTLTQNTVSELESNNKFFVFVTSQNESKFSELYGVRFMSAVGDLLSMNAYTEQDLEELARQFLLKLARRCRGRLSLNVRFEKGVVHHCVQMYTAAKGIKGMESYVNEEMYKAISEYVLRHPVTGQTLMSLSMENGELTAVLSSGSKEVTVPLKDYWPKTFVNPLDEVKKELNGIIGLDAVKRYVLDLENNIQVQRKREAAGMKKASVSMHMIFTGNPGTGKTTIARIVAKYLKAIGVLSIGQLREVTRGDLVGQYVGHTAKLTNEVIQSALGGVLFIDEAYALSSDGGSFGKEAIDTLVKLIEDYRGELAVILAGYKKEMDDFMKANSGLESRFPLRIEFPDYSAEELYEIALKMIDSKGFRIGEEAKQALRRQIAELHKTADAHSGNARMVRNFIENVLRNQSARIVLNDVADEDLTEVLPADIEPETGPDQGQETFDLNERLDKIIGLNEVKTFVRSLFARLKIQAERKKFGLPADQTQTLHMIFKGNPGTGKTMVARTIADVLYHIGVIRTNKLVETDRAGLVAGYVGQTAIKTKEKVMEALDGVLFIDEAYSLSQGGANDFGKEAIDTLVKLMDDYRERLVVILAGYSHDMDLFLQVNPGLKSRFPNIIEFADYSLDELMQIAHSFYNSKGYRLSKAAEEKLSVILREASQEDDFGNGRYVRNVFERSLNNQALRLSNDPDLTKEELVVIEAEDIEKV